MLLIFQQHQLNSSSESKMASLSLFTAPVGEKRTNAENIDYNVKYLFLCFETVPHELHFVFKRYFPKTVTCLLVTVD